MNEKRGQITIFIILGVVLLLTVAVVLYLGGLTTKERPKIEPHPVPTEFASVDEVFKQCIKDLSKKAFIELGTTGGYLNPKSYGFYSVDLRTTTGNAIELFPDSDILIPYWRHLKSSDNCVSCYFRNNVPSLENGARSIKYQVESYIEENVDECLDFSHLENILEVTLEGDPNAEITFTEEDVKIELYYFTNINDLSSPGRVAEVNYFSTDLDIKFKRLYNVAIDLFHLTALSYDNPILEKYTLDMLSYHSGINSELPPLFGGDTISFDAPKFWFLPNVEEKIKYVIGDTIKYNRVKKSFGYKFLFSDNTLLNNIVNNYLISLPTNKESLKRTKIDIDYLPWWNMYLKISPSSGALIQPTVTNLGLGLLPISIQKYHFNYDLSYPVLISLEDVESFDGTGYTLQFAYEVNIRNNNPLREGNVSIIEDVTSNFDEEANRNSGEIIVHTLNGVTQESLENVFVIYNCGDATAGLGVSSISEGTSKVIGKLPICLNGYVSGTLENYYPEVELLSTYLDESAELTLNLYPVKTFQGSVKKRLVEKSLDNDGVETWIFKETSDQFLNPDDFVILIIEKVLETENEEPFLQYATINGSQCASD